MNMESVIQSLAAIYLIVAMIYGLMVALIEHGNAKRHWIRMGLKAGALWPVNLFLDVRSKITGTPKGRRK